MGEIKNMSESITRTMKEIFDELGKQREKLGSLMVVVNNLGDKVEKIEEENIRLNKDLEDQKKEYEKKIIDATKQK